MVYKILRDSRMFQKILGTSLRSGKNLGDSRITRKVLKFFRIISEPNGYTEGISMVVEVLRGCRNFYDALAGPRTLRNDLGALGGYSKLQEILEGSKSLKDALGISSSVPKLPGFS